MIRLRGLLVDQRVATAARVVMGALFVYASATKFDPAKFAQEVANYRLLPEALVNFVAISLPYVELVAGVMLLLGLRIRAAALVIMWCLLGFIGGMSYAWSKGIDIECGCFGKGTRIGFRAIAEDVGMFALALEAFLCDGGWLSLDRIVARWHSPPPRSGPSA
jgi:putative oxidoreductase